MLKIFSLQSLSDLVGSKYIVGVESGYYYGEDYDELIKTSSFQANISEVIDLEAKRHVIDERSLRWFFS